jgi:hypothetical protein
MRHSLPQPIRRFAQRRREPTTVPQVILNGTASVATRQEPRGLQMPSYAWQLDDAQSAAVATYVRNSWGHAAGVVTATAAGTWFSRRRAISVTSRGLRCSGGERREKVTREEEKSS